MKVSCKSVQDLDWVTAWPPPDTAVHVYSCSVDELKFLIERRADLIAADEQEQAERFYHTEDAERFLLSRILCRLILSKYYKELDASSVILLKDRNKKPYAAIQNPVLYDLPYFNWTHSFNRILLAFSKFAVGVDVELVRNFDIETVAGPVMQAGELQLLEGSADKMKDFFILWTRKEALVKALGTGMTDELRQIRVLDGSNVFEIEGHEQTVMQITSFPVGASYMGSVCYIFGEVRPLSFIMLSAQEFAISF